MPECMLQCVCGYQPGKPRSRRSFFRLLKGNESFYSKINWSGERTRRERKVPERFNEYHLETEGKASSPVSCGEDYVPRHKASQKNGRMVSPQKAANGDAQPKKKSEPFRIKICADEINLLRWDSYVPLTKVYVAPDQEVLCIEHSKYSCPCLAENRRVIRILSKFVPPSVQFNSAAKKLSESLPSSGKAASTGRGVAKKHTHPSMRTAHLKKKGEPVQPEEVAKQTSDKVLPVSKAPDGMSKMRKLLQDERFQLQTLMTQEKMRAFDDEVDLTVRSGQTVQLVAWIRFHSVYQSGKMHIRFLSRRAGPVILVRVVLKISFSSSGHRSLTILVFFFQVMRPTEIVAADITCDIQDMRDKPNVPEIVKELLDPCISPEETCRYAFLLCDGVKWELVGCLSLKASTPAPAIQPAPANATKPRGRHAAKATEPKKSTVEKVMPDAPEVVLEEQPLPPMDNFSTKLRIRRKSSFDHLEDSPSSSPIGTPTTDSSAAATNDRLTAMEQRRIMLEQRLSQINSKLGSGPPLKLSFPLRPNKNKSGAGQQAAKRQDSSLVTPGPSSASDSGTSSPLPVQRQKKADNLLLTPDQCILPDDPPSVPLVPPSGVKYPAAETLAMFSRQAMASTRSDLGLLPFSSLPKVG